MKLNNRPVLLFGGRYIFILRLKDYFNISLLSNGFYHVSMA